MVTILTKDIWNNFISKKQITQQDLRTIIEKHLGKEEAPKQLKLFKIGEIYIRKTEYPIL